MTFQHEGIRIFPFSNLYLNTYSYSKDYYEKREKFVPKIKVKIIIDLDGARSGPNGLVVKCLEALEDEDEMDANMVNVTEKSKA